ncbi:ribonuclease HI [Trypanosoma cruzi]|nr:ribonuclease HI [Trypanosoma cruzi]
MCFSVPFILFNSCGILPSCLVFPLYLFQSAFFHFNYFRLGLGTTAGASSPIRASRRVMQGSLSGEGCAPQWATTQSSGRAMSDVKLLCCSVYLVRSPALMNWGTFSMHRCAKISPREPDGMLRSQASLCALVSLPY